MDRLCRHRDPLSTGARRYIRYMHTSYLHDRNTSSPTFDSTNPQARRDDLGFAIVAITRNPFAILLQIPPMVSQSLVTPLILAMLSLAFAPRGAQIVKLRQEVESLASELTSTRQLTRDTLSTLRAERADLERRVRLAKIRASTLRQLQNEQAERTAALEVEGKRWIEPARAVVANSQAQLDASIPFAIEQRRAALDRIATDLAGPQPDVAHAMERMWQFVQDERDMGREVARDRQVVTFEGEPQLVEVIRLGMALMYIRTVDGRVGQAVHADEGWRFDPITIATTQTVVAALFESQPPQTPTGPTNIVLPPGGLR